MELEEEEMKKNGITPNFFQSSSPSELILEEFIMNNANNNDSNKDLPVLSKSSSSVSKSDISDIDNNVICSGTISN